MPKNKTDKQFKITQVRSVIGCSKKHRVTVRTLGLRHREHSIIVTDSPGIRGMINQVNYLLKVEEA